VTERYYAGVYWVNRFETSQGCARRAETYFRLLASLDPTWAHWFGKTDTLEEALKLRIDPVAATFEALFDEKEYQLPVDGYSLGLWNGEQHPGATRTNFACGISSRFLSNACVLNPPTPARSPHGERIVNASTMTQVLRAMAIAWEPDWGVVMSQAFLDQIFPGKLPPVLVGWITYVSSRRGPIPDLPAPVHVEPVENLGTLITLTPERFTADNPAHVELAAHVRSLLDQAGLLASAQP
jgi:Immunity protein 52